MSYPALPAYPVLNAAAVLARVWRNLLRRRRERHDRLWLRDLNDHTLRDIGIHRGDIAGALRRGRGAP